MNMFNTDILLFVRDSAIPPVTGASGVYSSGLLKGIEKTGLRATVVSKVYFHRYKLMEIDSKKSLFHIRGLWYPRVFRSFIWAMELYILCKMFNPRIVFVRPPGRHFITGLKLMAFALKKIDSKKIIKVSHDPKKWVVGLSELLDQADVIVCETEGHRSFLKPHHRKKAEVIINGLDFDLFSHKSSPIQHQEKLTEYSVIRCC